jgi:hypothetical protein
MSIVVLLLNHHRIPRALECVGLVLGVLLVGRERRRDAAGGGSRQRNLGLGPHSGDNQRAERITRLATDTNARNDLFVAAPAMELDQHGVVVRGREQLHAAVVAQHDALPGAEDGFNGVSVGKVAHRITSGHSRVRRSFGSSEGSPPLRFFRCSRQ